jgi:protein-tyrosine phosphatase
MTSTLFDVEGPWSGRLAIATRPRGGEWLEDDVHALHDQHVDTLVSLLTKDEREELGLTDEALLAGRHGVEFESFPITDRSVPTSYRSFERLVLKLLATLGAGRTVAVHCRSAIGRSSLLAAALLVASRVPTDEAFRKIERARGGPVPDTPEQRAWVSTFAERLFSRSDRVAS